MKRNDILRSFVDKFLGRVATFRIIWVLYLVMFGLYMFVKLKHEMVVLGKSSVGHK